MNQQIKQVVNGQTTYTQVSSEFQLFTPQTCKTPMTRGWKQHSSINQVYFFLQLSLHSALFVLDSICYNIYGMLF